MWNWYGPRIAAPILRPRARPRRPRRRDGHRQLGCICAHGSGRLERLMVGHSKQLDHGREACGICWPRGHAIAEFFRPAGSVARLPSWGRRSTSWRRIRCWCWWLCPGRPGPGRSRHRRDDLVFAGNRVFPATLRTAIIHRLELPQGRFERRLRLPAGRYSAVRRSAVDGCLLITLQKSGQKSGASRG